MLEVARKVNILWVKADKLLPVTNGGCIRSYHISRQLAVHHTLTFFSYYDREPDPDYARALQREFPSAMCVPTGKKGAGGPLRGLDYLIRFPSRVPFAVSRFASPKVRQKLEGLFERSRFDVAVCDFLDAAINFPRQPSVPVVLFQHNVESEIWRRHAMTETNPAKRLVYKIEFSRMLAYERDAVRRFDHVIAVSEHDRQLMSAWVDASRITVVPTGVDLSSFRPEGCPASHEPLVMFVGAMDWEPNIDAVEYFCADVWPQVASQFPGARFRIVGRNPDRRVLKLASDTVEITGSVPSVVEHLRESAVVVVPLRIGGGTRLKIYEAMAVGKAVVSTTIGAEGLDVRHGEDIVLADSPGSIARAIVDLLRNPELRCRFESAAAKTAAQFGWPAIGDRFAEVLAAVVGKYTLPHARRVLATES